MKAGIVFIDLLAFAYKYNIISKAFKKPTEKELKQSVLFGKTPLKAKIIWKLVHYYDLLSSKNTKIPLHLKLIYKIINFLSIR